MDEPHNSFTNPTPQTARLIEVLEKLEADIKKQNSLKYALLRGMIYGLGTVIGATVLVALVGGIWAATIGKVVSVDITPSQTTPTLNEK